MPHLAAITEVDALQYVVVNPDNGAVAALNAQAQAAALAADADRVAAQAAAATSSAAAGIQYIRGQLQLPSATRPVRVYKPQAHRLEIGIRPYDAHYRDGLLSSRVFNDMANFELMNLAERYATHIGLTVDHLWTCNRAASRFEGLETEHFNLLWNDMVGTSGVDRGLDPSLLESMQFIGEPSTSISDINAGGANGVGSGPYHGNIDVVTANMLVTGGTLNGVALADGTNVRDTLAVGDVLFCTQFDIQTTWKLKDPITSAIVATVEMVQRFGGGTQYLLLPQITYDASKVTVGYIAMIVAQWANRLQARLAGDSLDSERTLGTSGYLTPALGNAERISFYRDSRPTHRWEFSNNSAYAPFRRNGAATAWTGLTPSVEFQSWGAKLRQPTHEGSTTADTETGNVITGYIEFAMVRANTA